MDYISEVIKITNCSHCKKKMDKIVRITKNGVRSNTSLICTNPSCHLKINIKKVATWEKI